MGVTAARRSGLRVFEVFHMLLVVFRADLLAAALWRLRCGQVM